MFHETLQGAGANAIGHLCPYTIGSADPLHLLYRRMKLVKVVTVMDSKAIIQVTTAYEMQKFQQRKF
jgi:hypothetical protein